MHDSNALSLVHTLPYSRALCTSTYLGSPTCPLLGAHSADHSYMGKVLGSYMMPDSDSESDPSGTKSNFQDPQTGGVRVGPGAGG